MAVLEFFGEPFCQRLAATLLHFVWQGFLIAGLAAGLIRILCIRRPQSRYVLHLATLVLATCCPLVTFFMIESSPESGNARTTPMATDGEAIIAESPRDGIAGDVALDGTTGDSLLRPNDLLTNQPAAPARAENQSPSLALRAGLRVFERPAVVAGPYVVLVWLIGVLLLSGRLLFGVAALSSMKRSRQPVPRQLAETLRRLGERFGFRAAVPVFVSAEVREALAVGLWRPMVLLPAGWLTGLPPAVIEAVIAHELAHVRRWDLWVNLFQRVVETVLFYHPAVWWLSARIRAEREMCCDELAVSVTGERLLYAEALELLAKRRLDEPRPLLATAMGDRKMALLNRVRHVLGSESYRGKVGWWSAGLIALAIPVVMWIVAAAFQPGIAAEDDLAVAYAERERPDGESPEAREAARRDREAAERRTERRRETADRDRPEPRREGREDPDRPRRRREPAVRDGDRPRHPDRERPVPRRRPEERPDRPREPVVRGELGEVMRHIMETRHKEREEMMRIIIQLREEVERLRREVHELRGRRGPEAGPPRDRHDPRRDVHRDHPRRERDAERDPVSRRRLDRPEARDRERGERERAERERRERDDDRRERGERDRDDDHKEGERERDDEKRREKNDDDS